MKLSIVIPIYKVEDVVERTLQSCINQELFNKDVELVIVNDGSPDHSMDVVKRVTSKYDNIRIIEQNNQGLSAARTTGFHSAKGEYIWYVDSDDYISPNSFDYIIPCLDGCDIVAIGFEVHKNGLLLKSYLPKKVFTGTEFFGNYYPQGAVFYIYRKDFLLKNNLGFINGIYHEDFEFIPRVLFLARTVRTVEYPIYYYIIRENSITTTFNSKRAFDLLTVAKSLMRFRDENNMDTLCKNEFANLTGLAINNSLSIIQKCSKADKEKWNKQFTKMCFSKRSLCKSSIKKYRIEGVLMSFLPFVSPITLYCILQKFNFKHKL